MDRSGRLELEPLREARLESAELARVRAKPNIAVGPQQQQAVFAALAVALRQSRRRRDRPELHHGREAVRKTLEARLEVLLARLARGQREQRAARMARELVECVPSGQIDVRRAVADRGT